MERFQIQTKKGPGQVAGRTRRVRCGARGAGGQLQDCINYQTDVTDDEQDLYN